MNMMNIDKETLAELTKNYFNFFESKNLDELKKLFSEDVILIDPSVVANGIYAVLESNSDMFNAHENINILEQTIYIDHYSNTAIGQIKIKFDNDIYEVVDIISYNNDMKISKIVAYVDTK